MTELELRMLLARISQPASQVDSDAAWAEICDEFNMLKSFIEDLERDCT